MLESVVELLVLIGISEGLASVIVLGGTALLPMILLLSLAAWAISDAEISTEKYEELEKMIKRFPDLKENLKNVTGVVSNNQFKVVEEQYKTRLGKIILSKEN